MSGYIYWGLFSLVISQVNYRLGYRAGRRDEHRRVTDVLDHLRPPESYYR